MKTRPYQRRRRGPVVAVVAVLAVLAAGTWAAVLVNADGATGSRNCPAPTAGPTPGEVLASDALDGVAPVPATDVRFAVFNAGGQRGQANLVAAQLAELGFVQAAAPGNDPFFPDGDMTCTGQIRFGPAGEAAASTLSLVVPCAQLVRDTRTGGSVDVSVGTAFGDLNPVKAARDALDQLAAPASGDTGTPAADPTTVAAARAATC